jgi:hypothetical protein
MKQLGYLWTDFNEIQYLIIFLKSVEGIVVGFLALEDGTDRLFQNVGVELLLCVFYVQ